MVVFTVQRLVELGLWKDVGSVYVMVEWEILLKSVTSPLLGHDPVRRVTSVPSAACALPAVN